MYPDEEAQLAVVRHNDTNDSATDGATRTTALVVCLHGYSEGRVSGSHQDYVLSRKIDDWFRLVDDGTQAGLRLEPDKRPRGATAHRLRKWFSCTGKPRSGRIGAVHTPAAQPVQATRGGASRDSGKHAKHGLDHVRAVTQAVLVDGSPGRRPVAQCQAAGVARSPNRLSVPFSSR